MSKIRRDAVLFADKWGVRCAARHFGFSPRAIVLRLFRSIKTFYMHNDSKVRVPDLRNDGVLMYFNDKGKC